MKQLLTKALAATAMAGLFLSVQGSSSDYQEMQMWLFESYTHGMNEHDNPVEYYQQKDAFYEFMDAVHTRVQQEYPVDPQLTKQVDDLKAEYEAARKAKLLEFGIADEAAYDEYYMNLKHSSKDPESMASDPLMSELNALHTELQNSIENVMKEYNDNFRKRYEAAFVEAVRKFQENGASMK